MPSTRHPLGTPPGLSATTGPLATAVWLVDRGLYPKEPKWSVEIEMPASAEGTRLRIEIFAEEWGYVFEHAGGQSWIRVTDLRFAHVKDDHQLLEETASLRAFGKLVRKLEVRFGFRFDREAAKVQTTIAGSDTTIREWLAQL